MIVAPTGSRHQHSVPIALMAQVGVRSKGGCSARCCLRALSSRSLGHPCPYGTFPRHTYIHIHHGSMPAWFCRVLKCDYRWRFCSPGNRSRRHVCSFPIVDHCGVYMHRVPLENKLKTMSLLVSVEPAEGKLHTANGRCCHTADVNLDSESTSPRGAF